jgi:hypothetical protein
MNSGSLRSGMHAACSAFGPARIRRRDVIDRRQVVLERTRNVDVRPVPAVVGRRLADQRLLRAGDRDDLLVEDELLERRVQLGAGNRDRSAFRLVGLHDVAHRATGARAISAHAAAGHRVASDPPRRSAGGTVDRGRDSLGPSQHGGEHLGADRVVVGRHRLLRLEVLRQISLSDAIALALAAGNSACSAGSSTDANVRGTSVAKNSAKPP